MDDSASRQPLLSVILLRSIHLYVCPQVFYADVGLPTNWTENTGRPSLPLPSPLLEVGSLNSASESGGAL